MRTPKMDIFSKERLDSLWRLACTILCNKEDARDVVQDVMMRVWEQPLEPVNVNTYLTQSIRNACIDRLRSRRNQTDSIPEIPAESNIDAMSDREIVRFAMDRLPENLRTTVHLKDIEGYDTSEIAQILGIQENNVRALLSRGRKMMRAIIEKEIRYEVRH